MPDRRTAPNPPREPVEGRSSSSLPKELAEIESVNGQSPTQNPLASYAFLPLDVDFENREPGEEVVLLLRQHPVTNLAWILGVIGVLVLSFLFLTPPVIESVVGLSLPKRVFVFADVLVYLLLFAYVFERFLLWFFNVFIITNRRLIDIDFHGLLSREVSETPIRRIQDVTYQSQGLAQSLLNYGSVIVQTAAAEEKIDFDSVPKPDKVADLISDLMQQRHHEP